MSMDYFKEDGNFDAMMLREALSKFHQGDRLSDDEILEVLRYIQPIEFCGWVLGERNALFVADVQNIARSLRGFQNSRVNSGTWRPTRDIPNPKFMQTKGTRIPTVEEVEPRVRSVG
jgi:hypothetical protein